MPTTVTKYAGQSVTIDEILDAMAALLKAATLYNPRYIIEWHSQQRPSVDANAGSIIWFRYVDREMDLDAGGGAARAGTKSTMLMEVNVTTRAFTDGSQRDTRLMRKHLTTRFLIENAFWGQMLFDSYADAIGSEPPKPNRRTQISEDERVSRRLGETTANPFVVSIAPMVSAKLPAPEHSRPEQGYLESRIGIAIPVVLRVTLDAAPELET